MISRLARDDFEDLKAQGLNPTLEDFDRLNQIALRLTDGAETTCANFPRVGWAGDVPFFQPTLAAFAWYYGHAARLAADDETANTFWWFALAHAREPRFFETLRARDEIEKAVAAWAESLPATRDEVARAARYAARGFDDAVAGERGTGNGEQDVRFRADRSAAAENLKRVEDQLVAACAALKCPPESLMGETQTRLDRLYEAAAVELGKTVARDEARLRADYDLTLREIALRLKAEISSGQRNDDSGQKKDGGDNVCGHVPAVSGTEPVRGIADGAPCEKPENIIVVAHDENDTISNAEGQA